MAHEPIFALVVDREIVLFPVTYDIMNERNNPQEDYYYCYYNGAPTIQNATIEYIEDHPRLIGTSIFVDQIIRRKTLEEIFTLIGLGPGSTVLIQDVLPEHLDAVVILTKERVQERLDVFAQTRGYDDIKSVATYVNSQIPSYQQEANRAIYLRDLTWNTLYTYLNGVMSGTTPLPETYADIETILPALTWS